MWQNADEMLSRAGGKPIRVASKSVRCRALLEQILGRPGFRGLMTFTLPETLWLAAQGFDDLLLAYPTADRAALGELGQLEGDGRPIVMVDSVDHLDLIARAAPAPAAPIRVCIEFDTGFHIARGRIKVGPKRSPIRTPGAGGGAGTRDRGAPGARAGGDHGLRGPHRRGWRPAARQAAEGRRHPADAAGLRRRAGRAARRRGRGDPGGRPGASS